MLKLLNDLKSRNRIFRATVDELLDPSEREMEDSPFDSQDPVKAVADVVISIAEAGVGLSMTLHP
jgi:hypothetical protein